MIAKDGQRNGYSSMSFIVYIPIVLSQFLESEHDVIRMWPRSIIATME